MDRFMDKLCQCFSHKMPYIPQYSQYRAPNKVYRATTPDTVPSDETFKLNNDKIKLIQNVIGVCMY